MLNTKPLRTFLEQMLEVVKEVEGLQLENKAVEDERDKLKADVAMLTNVIERKNDTIEELQGEVLEQEQKVKLLTPSLRNSVILNLDEFHYSLKNGNLKVQQRVDAFVNQLKAEC